MSGVKETKEALVGVLAIAKVVSKRLKDGVELDDAVALVGILATDEEFKSKIAAAVEGYKLIPEELKELSISEAAELIVEGATGVVDIVKELRA